MVKEGRAEGSQANAAIHFSGQSLSKIIGSGEKLRLVKSEDEVPQFLRLSTENANDGL